ncbi:hypothetical protein chiPu_0005564 [Chiloscyllium punctatum]|uniref:TGF-beta family profile domain-containing protein n=1 Tax=Chiloscyllium punctatum TaxID=137246 RepID=A0A401S9R8_CHIPU|nr:hypothetical protein [Chiloscyllium punctatum]
MELYRYYPMYVSIYLALTCSKSSEMKNQSGLRWRDEKQIRIETIKKAVMEQLGLLRPPISGRNISGTQEKKMQKLYRQRVRHLDQNIGLTNKDAIRMSSVNIFVEKGTVLETTGRTTNCLTSNKQRLYFNITMTRNWLVSPEIKILRGELKLYKHLQQNTNLHQQKRDANLQLVKIYQLLKPAVERKEFQRHFLGSTVITSNDEKTVMFDIRKTVEYWINYPQENYGLEFELIPWFANHKHTPEDKMTIAAELEIEMQKVFKEVRTRRESHTEDCQRNQIQCCRRPLHVSFDEIGWSDWIRAPLSYNAFYCEGTCPQKYKLATMHTLIKSKMNHLSNGAIPAPCCVPASYEPLTLLHFNSNSKLTLTAFDDMIVSRCHCS